jgi:hypothetical protein
MELFIISGYVAIGIALFTVFRIPLNKWTVPSASIGGIVLTFALIQLLNFYHPYSGKSQQHLAQSPMTTTATAQASDLMFTNEDRNVIAWFPQNSLLRLKPGNETEVTFDSIPGEVFAGLMQKVIPVSETNQDWARKISLNAVEENQVLIPVMIDITDRRYAAYASSIPNGSHAQVAIYGRDFQALAVVRKTLLRMSAWMNYLSPIT